MMDGLCLPLQARHKPRTGHSKPALEVQSCLYTTSCLSYFMPGPLYGDHRGVAVKVYTNLHNVASRW